MFTYSIQGGQKVPENSILKIDLYFFNNINAASMVGGGGEGKG